MNKEENIINTNLAEALTDRYLSYALSTIVSRSLPDVRDGLKPVHRRILYAMRELKLNPEGGFKKCARVVGDVIGKFHPHGDASVYDAMVRLAQDFSVRYPLVNGQGNFGNIDGDSAAAMRYTEAKLTEVAWLLMEGLDEDAVDFRDTYDGEENEPIVMPAKFPNLLANGSTGIAVGMATNIPPHNVIEICDALKALIQNPEITIENIVKKYIKAPDFPTGGVLIEPLDSIVQSYTLGKGAFKVRAKWEKEELSRGLYQIIITEIPYQVQKSKLIERIADLLENHKLPLINDIRDESTELIRIVIEPKSRTVNPEHIMEHLFKLTELESRFNMNLNVIDEKNIPKVMNLKEILQAFLRHRQQVLVRISNFNLNKILKRLEILEGYLIAYLNLDEVIKIIRENDEPRPILISRFNLTENQAEAILNMKLRALRKLEEIEIKSEHAKLTAEKEDLEKLLADENLRWLKIADEISEVKIIFSKKSHLGKRKTQLGEVPEIIDVPIEAFIEKEPITVIFSEKGWVRAVKSHVSLDEDFKFKDNDSLKTVLHTTTTDKILFFTNMGKFYTVSAADFPQGRGFGQPLSLFMDFEASEEPLFIFNYQKDEKLLVVSVSGRGFIVDANSVLAQTKNGKKILNLDTGEEAYKCLKIIGDTVAIIGENRRLLMFPVSEIPEMTRGRGVMLQKYKSGKMADIMIFNKNDGFTYLYKDKQRVEADLSAWFGKRAGLGRLPPVGFSRENKFDTNKNDGKF